MGRIEQACPTLPGLILNQERKWYEGDLVHYTQVLFGQATNLDHPYHNARHMLHVLYECMHACLFYGKKISMRDRRNLLIAALFHDFNHTGRRVPDEQNIARAVVVLCEHLLPEDRLHQDEIIAIIKATEFPYREGPKTLLQEIIRDADLSQTLHPAWLQQVVFGLASEWDVSPQDVLAMQPSFISGIKFQTRWAQVRYPSKVIKLRYEEAKAWIRLLESKV